MVHLGNCSAIAIIKRYGSYNYDYISYITNLLFRLSLMAARAGTEQLQHSYFQKKNFLRYK